MTEQVSMRVFLRRYVGVMDEVWLDHEAGLLKGIYFCRCGYRASEPEYLIHLADKMADAIQPTDVELPALFEAV
jgi:hypothetical protein